MNIKSVDYGKVIDEAKNLTFKHKWLWIPGFALALFAGNSDNFNFNSVFNSDTSNQHSNTTSQAANFLSQGLPQVLSATTSAISTWFHQIPITTWLYVALIVIIIIVLGFVIKVAITSWASGALIGGINLAKRSQKKVLLPDISQFGIATFKRLVVFTLIEILLMFGLIFGVGFITLVVVLLFSLLKATLLSLFILIPLGLVFVIMFFLFCIVSIYGQRLIVIHEFSSWQAWKRGLSLTKGNLIPTLVMGLINKAIGCAVGCLFLLASAVLLGIPAFLILLPVILSHTNFSWVHAVIVVLLFFVWGNLSLLVNGVATVFNYASWNLFVDEILAQEKKL